MIGGRQYGTDNVAVINSCERMDVKTLKWKKIAPMNEPRCTSMHIIHNERIFVAGGFFTNGERLKTFETYDPEKDVWYMLGTLYVIKASNSNTHLKQQSPSMMGKTWFS